MISKEELRGCLKNAKFEEEQIERILRKKIKTLLAKGKANEIEKILKVLNKEGIKKEGIENCLSVLARGKADEIEKILEILKENKVNKEIMRNNLTNLFLSDISEIENIFNDDYIDKDRGKHLVNVRMYMKLKGMYNREYSKCEIEKVCEKKHINLDEFIVYILLYPNNKNKRFIDIYKGILNQGNKIYIGKSITVDREYLEKHGAELIQLSQKVAKSFGKRYGLDRFELEDETMDIIVNKCGNLVRNLWTCPQVLDACIFNKTYKYLYARTYNSLKSQSIEILEENRLQKRNNLYTTDDNYEGELEDNVNLRKGGFDDIEQEVMRYMIKLVKEGEAKDIHKKVAEIMEIDEEEIVYIIGNIRQKMIANKLVKTRENGDVEFTI